MFAYPIYHCFSLPTNSLQIKLWQTCIKGEELVTVIWSHPSKYRKYSFDSGFLVYNYDRGQEPITVETRTIPPNLYML